MTCGPRRKGSSRCNPRERKPKPSLRALCRRAMVFDCYCWEFAFGRWALKRPLDRSEGGRKGGERGLVGMRYEGLPMCGDQGSCQPDGRLAASQFPPVMKPVVLLAPGVVGQFREAQPPAGGRDRHRRAATARPSCRNSSPKGCWSLPTLPVSSVSPLMSPRRHRSG